MDESKILCSASKYTEKFYLNPLYGNLPQKIKDELKVALTDKRLGLRAKKIISRKNLHCTLR